MADAVVTAQMFPAVGQAASTVIVHMSNISDGTGESAVKKVDIATILNYFGVKPSGLRIEQVSYSIQGFKFVQLTWDRTAGANTAMVLGTGQDFRDFRGLRAGDSGSAGGAQDFTKIGGIADPSAGNADGKGSILLTTNTNAAGNSYDITLFLRCEPNQT